MAYFHEAQANYLVQEVFFFIILSIQTLGVAYLRMWPEPSIFKYPSRPSCAKRGYHWLFSG